MPTPNACTSCGGATWSRPGQDGRVFHPRCKPEDLWRHGSENTYRRHGCRCDPCKAAVVGDSAAKWKKRARKACVVCGEPTGWSTSAPVESPMHPQCRPFEHGTKMAYRQRGCRCEPCKEWCREDARLYRASFIAEHGFSLTGKYRKPDDKRRSHYVSRATRLAIYARDGWTCQLCRQPVDPDLHHNHRLAATLDHIVPWSHTLFPDHSEANLRLVHRACNSTRRDRVSTEEVPVGPPSRSRRRS